MSSNMRSAAIRHMNVWMWPACMALIAALAAAQEPAQKFRIRVGDGAITGSEEFRIEKADSGYRLTSKVQISQMGRAFDMDQTQTLDADWSLVLYRLEARMMGQTQVVEAAREGDQVRMRATVGTAVKSESAPFTPMTVVLDNLVASHYQVLTNAMAGKVEAGADWQLLVPQRLAAVKGKVATGAREKRTLDGQPADVRKYTLELGSLLIEFWVEESGHRLMRVSVPLQKVEMTREGYVPAASQPEAAPPAAVERQVTFPSGDLQVPATLTLPSGSAGKVPLALLVHGSGPQDRDETIGPNKPFRDIAHGLASAGIATLRYDKRTFAFRDKIDRMITLDQEVTDDAVAALEYARTLPEIRQDAFFLLGHSLGGMMAPYIAQRFPGLRGVVLMAAAARPLDQLIYEQVALQSRLAGLSQNQVEMKVTELKMAFLRARSGEAKEDEMILGAPVHYWRDSFRLDVPGAMAAMKPAVLVLQGGKDVQVGKVDYETILKALAGRPETEREAHWLPDLNHLFMKVVGEATGAEYGSAGRVDPEPLRLIASWIAARP